LSLVLSEVEVLVICKGQRTNDKGEMTNDK
jgi:hypothetical protein